VLKKVPSIFHLTVENFKTNLVRLNFAKGCFFKNIDYNLTCLFHLTVENIKTILVR